MLVVVTIIIILASFSVGFIGSLLTSNNLGNTAQLVKGQLTFARQTAIASDHAVEVRFYTVIDGAKPSIKTCRAIQCFQETASGTTPLTKVTMFPNGIITGTNTTVSSLFNTSSSGFGISSSLGDTVHPLPPPNNSSPYFFFRYRPTGQTDLTPPANTGTNTTPVSPCVTLYSEMAPVKSNTLPSNFITIQVDVMNGTVRTYQP
jgi:uncharacterized protein (TIGR02596 family)